MNQPTKKTHINWYLFDDADTVAQEAFERILKSADEAIASRGVFHLVLSGGRTPEAIYRLLAGADADWPRWEIYFGDERCLPVNDPERNSTMADKTFLNSVTIPTANIYPIPSEKGAETAAEEYEAVVKAALPFDVVLLGIGEDGHTASLFPGQKHPSDLLVYPIHNAPKPPSDRVSLSAAALSDTKAIMVLATGSGKRDAIQAWQDGEALPISEIGGVATVDVLMDRTAHPSQ